MQSSERIRVLVVHDDLVVQVGLSAIFGRQADFAVEPEQDLETAHARLFGPGRCPVDVVVADHVHGIDIAARLAGGSTCKVVIASTTDREWEIRCALATGVRGYILVGRALDQLAAGVRAVHRGARYLSPEVSARLAESLSVERLTGREEEVLRLVVEGLCNKAIGRRLGIAVGTVKSHLKSIFDKLLVESRTQAIAAVERRGLLCESTATGSRSGGTREIPQHSQALAASRYAWTDVSASARWRRDAVNAG